MKLSVRYAVVAALALGCWAAVAPLLQDYLIVDRPLSRADVIVVLGGSSEYTSRSDKAAELYRNGTASKILVTDDGRRGGWDTVRQRNPSFAERSLWRLEADGVPTEASELLPGTVDGTGDEATLVAEYAAEKGIRSVLLVTSSYHSRRALWLFEQAANRRGLRLIFGVAFPQDDINSAMRPWWLTRAGWTTVGSEYVKFVYYRVTF